MSAQLPGRPPSAARPPWTLITPVVEIAWPPPVPVVEVEWPPAEPVEVEWPLPGQLAG